jgi:hypothetical protein
MIYSDDFVWLHFPKCAGGKVENLFRTYYSSDKRIFQDIVDAKIDPHISWHDSVSDRERRDPNFVLGNRTVICSFRRLPTWLESRYSFEVKRSPQLNHQPELLLEGKFLERGGKQNHADFYARKYIPETILPSGKIRFIRTEHFESDFKRIFGEFLDVAVIPNGEFRKRVNVSKSALPDEIRKKLFQQQQEVYEKCPYWKSVENMAYG